MVFFIGQQISTRFGEHDNLVGSRIDLIVCSCYDSRQDIPMIKRFGQCCAAVALFALIGCKDQKLADDLEWMNNTYNAQEGTVGHGRSGWYTHTGQTEKLAKGTIDSFKNDGCAFEFRMNDDPASSTSSVMLTSMVLKVNLRDIDPDSVKLRTFSHYGGFNCADYTPEQIQTIPLNCDYSDMRASTRNARPAVQEEIHTIYPNLTGEEHEITSNSKGPEGFLGFDDPEYAKTFAGVFQDAVKRCGGTKGAAS